MSDISMVAAEAQKLNLDMVWDAPLSRYNTFKVGGNARLLVEINSEQAAERILASARSSDVPFFVLGNGSNVIPSDDGYDGVILHIGHGMSDVSFDEDESVITAQSGAMLSSVCKLALDNSLTGMEFAYGIPGSVGGAVYMNAGAYGGEVADVIESCRAIDESGHIVTLTREDMQLSYRHSVFCGGGYIILSARFALHKGERDAIRVRMDELMEKRRSKQPLEYPSAGSTFKRPEGSYASLLIEQCGLKGLSVGGAQVSKKHSGFIINTGNATCKDIVELIDKVRADVYAKTGYMLEAEPVFLKNND